MQRVIDVFLGMVVVFESNGHEEEASFLSTAVAPFPTLSVSVRARLPGGRHRAGPFQPWTAQLWSCLVETPRLLF